MTTLLVLRHAKSSWDDAALDDHERPLNTRGRRDAPRMGTLVREYGLIPDVVISSDAVRALIAGYLWDSTLQKATTGNIALAG
jgi:phosphohistidine phosphatase